MTTLPWRYVLVVLLMPLAGLSAQAVNPTPGACTAISPGGDLVVTHFLAAPVLRVREILADALQAAGVVLFRDTENSIEGERLPDRVKVLRLPGGGEALRATLSAATEDGQSGTEVRVETMRHSFKAGTPKQSWSAAVMSQAVCLSTLLSLDDPRRRPPVPVEDPIKVRVPASTSLEVRSRHFFFSTDLRVGQTVPFETASPVVIDGASVIPTGSFVAATVQHVSDSTSWGHASEGQLLFKFVRLPDGTKLPLRSEVHLTGKSNPFSSSRLDFAVPAGTETTVQFDGEQEVSISRKAASASSNN